MRAQHHRAWLEAALFGVLAVLFASIKMLQHWSFESNDFDTGIYSNLAWNIAHGRGFWSDVLQVNHLGEHFSPVMVLFAPLYWLWASAQWLMIVQGVAVAATFPLLLRVTRHTDQANRANSDDSLCSLNSCVILALALLSRPLLSALWFEFHPSTLGMPLVAAAVLAVHARRPWVLGLCVAALLTTKESASLTVVALGVYAALVLRSARLGALLIGVGALAGVLIIWVIMPHFRDGPWTHAVRWGPFDLLPLKTWYLAGLLLGAGLLPLFAWRALAAALLPMLLNLVSRFDLQLGLNHHYDDQGCVLLLIAAAHGLSRLRALVPARGRGPLFLLPVLALAVAFRGQGAVSALRQAWPRPWAAELHQRLAPYVALGPDEGIAAQMSLGPHICHRRRYFALRDGFSPALLRPGDLILLSSRASAWGLDRAAFATRLAADSRYEQVDPGPVLEVWRIQSP